MRKLLVLKDYRGAFWSSVFNTKTLCTIDLEKFKKYLESDDIIVIIKNFTELDFSLDYSNYFVFYTSSEDKLNRKIVK